MADNKQNKNSNNNNNNNNNNQDKDKEKEKSKQNKDKIKKTGNEMVDDLQEFANKDFSKKKTLDEHIEDYFKIFVVGMFLLGAPLAIGLFAAALSVLGGIKVFQMYRKAKADANEKNNENKDITEKAADALTKHSPDGKDYSAFKALALGKDGKPLSNEEFQKKLNETIKDFAKTEDGKKLLNNPAFEQFFDKTFGKGAMASVKDIAAENQKEVDYQEAKVDPEMQQYVDDLESEYARETNNSEGDLIDDDPEELIDAKDEDLLDLNQEVQTTPDKSKEQIAEELFADEHEDLINFDDPVEVYPGNEINQSLDISPDDLDLPGRDTVMGNKGNESSIDRQSLPGRDTVLAASGNQGMDLEGTREPIEIDDNLFDSPIASKDEVASSLESPVSELGLSNDMQFDLNNSH